MNPLDASTLFTQEFGFHPAWKVLAPGRLELLGNHTDYNQGLVMALAIDRFIGLAVAPRTDGRIELISSAFPGRVSFSVSRLEKDPAAPWADYVKGVLVELRRREIPLRGFNAAIHGTIPLGAGLSSSAALEVATALAVRKLYPFTLTATGTAAPPVRGANGQLPPLTATERMALAKLCQAAENQFVGVNCGLLDQISSLFGRAAQVVQIDCQDLSVELTPLAGEVAVVVCNSGVKHALVAGAYNELRRQCEAAAQALGVPSLRRVDTRLLAEGRPRLTERQYQCAYHIVGENHRVLFGARALLDNDLTQFGQYLFQSHESSRDFFHNSCPELDLLVDLARAHPACLGARLTGGGFGGATLNLVRVDQVPAFSQAIAAHYERQTGHALAPLVCRVVDGAE